MILAVQEPNSPVFSKRCSLEALMCSASREIITTFTSFRAYLNTPFEWPSFPETDAAMYFNHFNNKVVVNILLSSDNNKHNNLI
jgi:hypothetical protein